MRFGRKKSDKFDSPPYAHQICSMCPLYVHYVRTVPSMRPPRESVGAAWASMMRLLSTYGRLWSVQASHDRHMVGPWCSHGATSTQHGSSRRLLGQIWGRHVWRLNFWDRIADVSERYFCEKDSFLQILIQKSIDLSEMWLKLCEKDGFLQILILKPMDLSVFAKINENFRKKHAFLQILIQKPMDLSKKSRNFRKFAKYFGLARLAMPRIASLASRSFY